MADRVIMVPTSGKTADMAMLSLDRYCEKNGVMLDSIQRIVIETWFKQLKWEVPSLKSHLEEVANGAHTLGAAANGAGCRGVGSCQACSANHALELGLG